MVFCSQKVGVFSEEACVVSVSSICGCAVSERFLISDIQNYIRKVSYIRYLKIISATGYLYPILKIISATVSSYPIPKIVSEKISLCPKELPYIRLDSLISLPNGLYPAQMQTSTPLLFPASRVLLLPYIRFVLFLMRRQQKNINNFLIFFKQFKKLFTLFFFLIKRSFLSQEPVLFT